LGEGQVVDAASSFMARAMILGAQSGSVRMSTMSRDAAVRVLEFGTTVRIRFRCAPEVIDPTSPHARAFATLALHHLVALLEQTFALAILAFLLLLDVRAFFTNHEILLPRESGHVR